MNKINSNVVLFAPAQKSHPENACTVNAYKGRQDDVNSGIQIFNCTYIRRPDEGMKLLQVLNKLPEIVQASRPTPIWGFRIFYLVKCIYESCSTKVDKA